MLSFLVVKPDDFFTGLSSLKRSIWSAGRYVMQLVDEKVANGNDDYDVPKMLDRSRSLQAEALTFVGQTKTWGRPSICLDGAYHYEGEDADY